MAEDMAEEDPTTLRLAVEAAHTAYAEAFSSGASDADIVACEEAVQAAEQAYEAVLGSGAAEAGATPEPDSKVIGAGEEVAAPAAPESSGDGGLWPDFVTLESLKWKVDPESGVLQPVDPGDTASRRVDQLVLLNAATRFVQETLIESHGFTAIPLPLEGVSAEGGGSNGIGSRCTVFASEGWSTATKLLIVVQPVSGQRSRGRRGGGALPGIWSRGLLLDHGMHGSMLGVVRGASAEGWGVILCDPNTPSAGNETSEKHLGYVWEKLVLGGGAAASDVSFLAFSNGGALVKSLLTSHEASLLPRCRAVALIESSHRLVGELSLSLEPAESKGLIRFLQKRTVNWQCVDPTVVGRAVPQLARVPEIEELLGCVTLSVRAAYPSAAVLFLLLLMFLLLFPFLSQSRPSPPRVSTRRCETSRLRSTSRCPPCSASSRLPSAGASVSEFYYFYVTV